MMIPFSIDFTVAILAQVWYRKERLGPFCGNMMTCNSCGEQLGKCKSLYCITKSHVLHQAQAKASVIKRSSEETTTSSSARTLVIVSTVDDTDATSAISDQMSVHEKAEFAKKFAKDSLVEAFKKARDIRSWEEVHAGLSRYRGPSPCPVFQSSGWLPVSSSSLVHATANVHNAVAEADIAFNDAVSAYVQYFLASEIARSS